MPGSHSQNQMRNLCIRIFHSSPSNSHMQLRWRTTVLPLFRSPPDFNFIFMAENRSCATSSLTSTILSHSPHPPNEIQALKESPNEIGSCTYLASFPRLNHVILGSLSWVYTVLSLCLLVTAPPTFIPASWTLVSAILVDPAAMPAASASLSGRIQEWSLLFPYDLGNTHSPHGPA